MNRPLVKISGTLKQQEADLVALLSVEHNMVERAVYCQELKRVRVLLAEIEDTVVKASDAAADVKALRSATAPVMQISLAALVCSVAC